eukprot:TRINITY_DN28283_c0_g1_i2.p1 TRINITY_DN28283_c0_g1~~TRINITY_DN28283_c0_g1_i2.p1  ORF type:complete len:106 (-),score=0.99 TRINITY_DN28283_c0_g1_i2:16-333(-)
MSLLNTLQGTPSNTRRFLQRRWSFWQRHLVFSKGEKVLKIYGVDNFHKKGCVMYDHQWSVSLFLKGISDVPCVYSSNFWACWNFKGFETRVAYYKNLAVTKKCFD